jgi:hypothetical protein
MTGFDICDRPALTNLKPGSAIPAGLSDISNDVTVADSLRRLADLDRRLGGVLLRGRLDQVRDRTTCAQFGRMLWS